ncbi:unnamed protein product [Parnassius apollo]|uniref:(apollo) hypothetical protein n=1 Tax=Parnassius apollo TaxID=110799 RepID=A0A8S3XT39_PARAO|nr:unnamed protein product [Parnassius apollo]
MLADIGGEHTLVLSAPKTFTSPKANGTEVKCLREVFELYPETFRLSGYIINSCARSLAIFLNNKFYWIVRQEDISVTTVYKM